MAVLHIFISFATHMNNPQRRTNRMMLWLAALAALLAWTQCRHEPSGEVERILRQAETCMEQHPDSALCLLQGIGDKEAASLKGEAQAHYALLYTQACDKNRMEMTNDSLIQIAVEHYKDRKQGLKAAQSYFYLGCVYRNTRQDAKAIEAFLEALGKMPQGMKHKLKMQIYYNLGKRYYNQSLYSNSMEMYRKCLSATQELNDSSFLFFPYRGIADAFLLTEESDSALMYYQRALNISEFVQNKYWEAAILNDMSKTYLYQKDTLKAEQFIAAAIRKDKSAGNLYLKSELLYHRNKPDSARLLLLEGCQSHNLRTKASCYSLLYEIEKQLQNHPNAYAYNDSFNLYRDSIEILQQHQEIQDLHTQYAIKLQKKEAERREEKILWTIYSIFIIFLSSCLCFYLYLRKRYKEYLLRKKILTLSDQSQTISNYLETKLGQTISLPETATTFKRELLQKGTDAFHASPWKEALDEAEKRIKPGEYMNHEEQSMLYQKIQTCFKEFITGITRIYPKLTREDIIFCILSTLGYKSRTIVYCMRTPGGALRTRKARLKKNMAEDTFRMIFPKGER